MHSARAGTTNDTITAEFEEDVPLMAERGYRIESQQLIVGKRGGFLTALGVITLGLLVLLYRPDDTLVVTFRLEER